MEHVRQLTNGEVCASPPSPTDIRVPSPVERTIITLGAKACNVRVTVNCPRYCVTPRSVIKKKKKGKERAGKFLESFPRNEKSGSKRMRDSNSRYLAFTWT